MAEITKTNEEQKKEPASKSLKTVEVIAVLFFLLNLASSFVIMLLPLGILGKAFSNQPHKALWLLFVLSLALMVLLNALSAPKDNRRSYWKFFGTVGVVVGFLCAVEIFLLQALGIPHHSSLWWLLAIVTVLGAIGVSVTEKLRSLERAEAKRKEEAALTKKRRTIPTVVRYKVRRYYVAESKRVVCEN